MLEDIIKKRRSISCFLDRPVEIELIDEIIELASHAPSSCNTQPWYFVVFSTEDSKKQLTHFIERGYQRTLEELNKNVILAPLLKRLFGFFSQYGKFDDAPVYVLLFSRPYDTPLFSQAIKISRQKNVEKIAEESVRTSTAMAMQNFLLAAHDKGLGTRVKDGIKFLINFEDLKNEFYKELAIPNEFILISGIQIGYPAEGTRIQKIKERLPLEKIRKHI